MLLFYERWGGRKRKSFSPASIILLLWLAIEIRLAWEVSVKLESWIYLQTVGGCHPLNLLTQILHTATTL